MGIVRGISYGLFGAPNDFGPAVRGLKAGLVRAYLYWNQVEPEPGLFDWAVVDRLLEQVAEGGRLWLTVCSSSTWATQVPTTFLPPSPPLDPEAYAGFVSALARRCRGRVHYWQCENEPSNIGLLWQGSAADYAEHLSCFAAAVRSTLDAGQIVLGGIGYDVLSTDLGSEQWAFFETVCRTAGSSFDLVDVHLYDDPRRITVHLHTVRRLLAGADCHQELVVGEYGGPTIFEFPAAEQAVQTAMLAAFAAGATPAASGPGAGESPDRVAMRGLYQRFAEQPAELQQFLDGAPGEIAARRNRIACRELITRNLTAFAEGITTTCYWDLAPEVPDYTDPYNMLGLISARLALLTFERGALVDAQPAAATFRMLAGALADANAVRPISHRLGPDVHAYEVVFPADQRALHVLWRDADPFAGDFDAAELVEWPWPFPTLHAADALTHEVAVANVGERRRIPLSATPILLSSAPLLSAT